MARNSEFFLGDNFIDVIKLGDDDIKIYLQDTLIYQPRISISTATVTCNVATYNGNPQNATTIQVTVGGNQLTLNEDFIVTSNTGGTNVGSYNVTVQGIGLYKGNASGTFTINKVTPTVVAPVPNVLTYNGTAQKLVTPGSTNFGTLKYKVGSSGSYSTNIPTRTRGGAYTVYYKVDGDSNINGVPENSVACSINEKPVTAVVAVSPSSYTYSGSYCEPTVTVKDGETVIDPSEYTVTYSNNLNAGTATVTIYDVVGGNYYVTGSTTFKIAKQTPVLATSPTSTSPTYNGSVQNLLTGGSMKHSSSVSTAVPGSFTYDQGTNAGSYSNPKWYFTPTDTTNYNSTNGTVKTTTTISCSSNYTITAPTAKSGLVYNGSSQTLYNAGSSATVSGSFGYTGGTMTNAGSQTVSWVFTPSSANYCSKNGSFTGSIAQKAISIPTPTGVSRAYNGNAATATFGSATGASITKYRYSTNGSSWTESTTNPSQINAGTLYTQAYYKANNANYSGEGWSNSATITISKANQSAPTASGATTTYNTTATATASGGGGQGYIEWSNGNTQTSVGSKATKARWSGNGNYNASPWSNSVTVQMNKAAGSVTTAPVNNNYTYNGTARAVATAGSGTGTMYYRLGSSGSFSTTMPTMTDAGSSTLYYYAAASANYEKSDTGSITVSVQKASQSAPTAYGATTTYNTTATATASGGGKQGSIEWSNGNTQTSVGSKATKARWSGNGNYNASPWSNSVTVQMNKAAGSVTTAPVNNNYTYNGTARAVATAGSGTGTMYYRLGSSGSFSTTMPTMTDAGSSTLYYYAAASANYEKSATGSITVSVQKASQSAPTATGATTTYNTTATATASGGGKQGSIEWSNGNTQTSVGSKTTMARWSGNSNYNASPWSNEVTVKMNKAAGSVTTAPVNNNYTYNGTARAVATAGSGTGTMYYRLGSSGSFSTTMPTMTNAYTSTLYYYAAASTNYEQSATGSITVSIQKANQSAPTATGATTTYNTPATATASGGGKQGSIEWSNGNTQTSVGSKTTMACWSGNGNYNASPWSNSVTLTMNKVTPTVTAPTLKTGLVYNGKAQELVTPGSTNYGTLMYRDTEITPESDWDTIDWITTVPTATNSNSELPHQIQYKVVGNSNVNDVAMVKLGSTSIARANSTISATIPPTITVGSTASITNVSSTGDGYITYSSSDTSKATVSSSGVITGKAAGTVTITVTMGPGINYNPSSTSKTVTINAGTTTVTAAFMGPPFNRIGGTIDLKNFAFYGVSDNNAYVPLLIKSNNQDVTSSFKNKNGGKPLRDLKNYCVLNSIYYAPTLITNMFANVPTYSGSYSITISRNGQIRYDKNSDTITIYFVTG